MKNYYRLTSPSPVMLGTDAHLRHVWGILSKLDSVFDLFKFACCSTTCRHMVFDTRRNFGLTKIPFTSIHCGKVIATKFFITDDHVKIILACCDISQGTKRFLLEHFVLKGRKSVIEIFLEHGMDARQDRLLEHACAKGYTEIVELLLDHGANIRDYALPWASQYGHTETVRLLLDCGVRICVFFNAVEWAMKNDHEEVVQLLWDHCVHKYRDKIGVDICTTFMFKTASKLGFTEMVRVCLNRGVDVHVGNDYALRQASLHGHTETVRLLLDFDADVRAVNDDILRYVYYREHIDVLKLLLDRGVNIECLLQERNYNLEVVRRIHAGGPKIT